MKVMNIKFKEMINHFKKVGYIYSGSEIYGGVKNTWDFGPLGILLKREINKLWIEEFITRENNVLIESNLLLHPKVWKSSGHVKRFIDYFSQCKKCNYRIILDNIKDFNMCPKCLSKDISIPKKFNLLLKTSIGKLDSKKSEIYLRPENAQGIFINFHKVQKSLQKKIPFGIGQISKAYRNEITPRNFIFKTREFELMELEYFCEENEIDKWFNFYYKKLKNFLFNIIGLSPEKIIKYEHNKDELSHYSQRTIDFLFDYPFGKKELCGISNRGNYDIKNHNKNSQEKIYYENNYDKNKIIPFVVEPTMGVERLMLAILSDKYDVDTINDNKRLVLRLPAKLAPYKVAFLPLNKKLSSPTKELYNKIKMLFSSIFSDTGSIGKRYRKQDEIGTLFCITYDFNVEKTNKITVRFRDDCHQIKIKVTEIELFLKKNIK